MFLVILLYMLFASTFTFGKAVLTYIQPIMFIGIRMTAAGLLLLGYQYCFNRSKWRLEREDWAKFMEVGFFLMFVSFVAEFWAMQYVSAAKACLLYNLSPFITALFAYWLLREQLTGKQWVGLGIGILGFIPILMNQIPTDLSSVASAKSLGAIAFGDGGLAKSEALTTHIGFISMPELALLIAVVSTSYGWIAMKKLVVVRGYSTIMVNGTAMLGGGILAILSAVLVEKSPWIRAATDPGWGLSPVAYAQWAVFGYTLFLILIANVICFNLYSWLLHRYSTTFISFAGFSTPLFAALFDLLYFGQGVSMSFFETIGLVGIGIYIFYQDELKNS